jgi:molybdopterin-containing oxidoreductase family membrane subunit
MSEREQIQGVFAAPEAFAGALRRLREAGFDDLEAHAPASIEAVEDLMPRRGSPVRLVTLVAGVTGCVLGFWVCLGSAWLYALIVGGKPPAAIVPYCVVGFEGTILLGGVTVLLALLGLCRLWPGPAPPDYRPGFSADTFGITVRAAPEHAAAAADLLWSAGAEEVHEVAGGS